MSLNQNQFWMEGRLGKDPEVRYTAGGTAVANFSVAASRYFKSKDKDDYEEETTWIDFVAWGVQAEKIAARAQKGAEISVISRLQNRNWETKEGVKMYKVEAVVISFSLGQGQVRSDTKSDVQDKPQTQLQDKNASSSKENKEKPTADESDELPF